MSSKLAAASAGLLFAAGLGAGGASGQSINVDFGPPGAGPAPTYGAAGLAGTWNSIPALHNTTTVNLLGLDGLPTAADLRQFGGLETLSVADPDTAGDDGVLMDDYLVTFAADLESCIFMTQMIPGAYEVLIYARMPNQPGVLSETWVDQEPGAPRFEVGGPWPGGHQELVTYSRHLLTVGADGRLDFHSGIAPAGEELDGAALNGVQFRLLAAEIFKDGFESGDTSKWTVVVSRLPA